MRKIVILLFALVSNYIFAMNTNEMKFGKTNYSFNYSMQINTDSVNVSFLCTILKTNELLSMVFVDSPILKETDTQLIGDQDYIDKLLVGLIGKNVSAKFDQIKNQFDIQSCISQVNRIFEEVEINDNRDKREDTIIQKTKRSLQGIITNICLSILFEFVLLRDLENEKMVLWNDDIIISSKSTDKVWETRIKNKKEILNRKMEQRLDNDVIIKMSLEAKS
jgi:hypothetical protein